MHDFFKFIYVSQAMLEHIKIAVNRSVLINLRNLFHVHKMLLCGS